MLEDYRSTIAQAIRGYNSQSQVDQHGDLVTPSHGDIWKAMDLGLLAVGL